MDVQEKIGALFPAESDIPAEFQIAEPIIQEVYLVNGELKPWDGPWQEVYSPVQVTDGAGLAPKFLGRYPLMPTAKAEEIMAAAVKAYDNGRGFGRPSACGSASNIPRILSTVLERSGKKWSGS